jgi:hypothetical protein
MGHSDYHRLAARQVILFGYIRHIVYFAIYPFCRVGDLTESLQFTGFLVDFMNTMWCRQCQQDVPAISGSGESKFCCPRCGETVGDHRPKATETETALSELPPVVERADEIPSYDSWELEDRLWHIGHLLEKKVEGKVSETFYSRGAANVGKKKVPDTFFLSLFSWTALSLGTAALVCGGVLLGWSVITGRSELWTVGLPIAAAGQIALLFGITLQLFRFWHVNDRTESKLDEVDGKLDDLQSAAVYFDSMHGPVSAPFYIHSAGGSKRILHDLRSELDSLTKKIDDLKDG